MTITPSTLDGLSDCELFILFLMAFHHSGVNVGDVVSLINSCSSANLTTNDILKACSAMERKHLIYKSGDYGRRETSRYGVNAYFDMNALRFLRKVSVQRNWWKVFEVHSLSGRPYAEPKYHFPNGAPSLHWYANEALVRRALVDSTGMEVDILDLVKTDDEYWQPILSIESRIALDCALPEPVNAFGPSNPFELYLRFAGVRFVRGGDIRPALRHIVRQVAEGKLRLTENALCEVTALCVLTGTDWNASTVAKWEVSEEAKSFATIATTLRSGDLATANKMCLAVAKASPSVEYYPFPAFALLSIFVNLFSKPAATRVMAHLRNICPSMSTRFNSRPSGARALIEERNRVLGRIKTMLTGLRTDAAISPESFTDNLGEAIWALLNGLDKRTLAFEAVSMMKSAECALNRGYPTLAGVFLSVFGWALPEAMKDIAKNCAKAVEANGGVIFRAFDAQSSEWKQIIQAFDERLPRRTSKRDEPDAKVRAGRIIWMLGIDHPDEYVAPGSPLVDNLVCHRVIPYYRGPRAAEDGSGDKPVSLNSVYSGKYDGCLTEADKVVVSELTKAGYSGPRHLTAVPAEALEAMCGADNVMVYAGKTEIADAQPAAAQLLRRDVPIDGKSGDDGSISLRVPDWSVGVTRPYVLREKAEGVYAYSPFTKTVRSLIELFKLYGDEQVIRFPKEAKESLKPVFERLASVLPLQGALANVGGEHGLARANGNATPLVRLALDDESRLHVSLRVRPLPSEKEILFEAGAGQSERTVNGAHGPVILVRDLAREKAEAERVAKALGELSAWRESAGEWQIDEITDALSALAVIRSLGDSIQVEWQPGKRLSVFSPQGKIALSAAQGVDHWFEVSGEWTVDEGRVISLVQLLEHLDGRVGCFVPIDEKGYLRLNRALLRQLDALRTAGLVGKGKLRVSPAALPMLANAFTTEQEGLELPKDLAVESERIQSVFSATPEIPADFKCTMRPYQTEGYVWLSHLYDCGIGACLADDMGLGKTIQLIALILSKRTNGASLVVAPASVSFNWRNEIARFAPSLRCVLVGQSGGASEENVTELAKANDVIITSYGVESSRQEAFDSVDWNIVVLDEAQAIKNHATQRAKSVKTLKARFRVAATGTPIENRLTELWSIFDFINPGFLGGETHFTKELAPHGEATPQLKRLVKPLILRRIKREVLTDLPEKEEITVPVVLGEAERTAYEATRVHALSKIEQSDPTDKLAILAELTRLRRFCCHPSLVMPGVDEAAKLETLDRLLAGLRDNGHRALVFSQFVDFLSIVRKRIEANGWTYEYLDGSTSKVQRETAVARFQEGKGDFFLISLKAGGMGLNLTAANYVILLDPWWNPAVENQAADRVHRIGQKLPVTVYRLIAQDTIEEKVVKLHESKKALAEDVLASGASTLSAAEMIDLLKRE